MFTKFESIKEDRSNSSEESVSNARSSVSSESSCLLFDTNWGHHVAEDGSLLYIESYVSSTVKEKHQHSANRTINNDSIVSRQKNIKHQSKLLNLLRRRPSVRLKSPSNLSEAKSGGSTNKSNSEPPKVTFRDDPNGESRKIFLYVHDDEVKFGRRTSLCEKILGIMPGRFKEPPDTRVMVAGLTPGSQALKDGFIKIGDWLKEINEKEITCNNLDSVLLEIEIPSSIVLTVQKCASETVHEEESGSKKKLTQTQLVKLLVQKSFEENEEALCRNFPLHCVLFISLAGVTESSPERADIRYEYPSGTNKLIDVRGMLITADHSLLEITGCPIKSSSITIDEEDFHIGFYREGEGVLMIGTPGIHLSEYDVTTLTNHIATLLIFEFGSLESAFFNVDHAPNLNHFFNLVFNSIFCKEVASSRQDTLTAVPSFTINDDLNLRENLFFSAPRSIIIQDDYAVMQVETCLNELESADFGDEDCEDCQLLYNIMGCCIFYKGYLVASHLDAKSLKTIWLYLTYHKYLDLTTKEAVSQLVLWRRIFPPDDESVFRLSIVHNLLVVGMNHVVLAMIVDSGSITELIDETSGPDAFLVDQAETTLYHFHSLHLPTIWEESLINGGIQSITLDNKINGSSNHKKSSAKLPAESMDAKFDVPSILKQKYSTEVCQSPDSEPSFEEEDTSRSLEEKTDDDTDSHWRIWKGQEGRISYEPEVLSEAKSPISSFKITIGKENILFHAIQLDCADGIIISPHISLPFDSPLHSELMQKFYSSCAHIKHVLRAANNVSTASTNYETSSTLSSIKEYGVMFSHFFSDSAVRKKKNALLNYWVIGRIYPSPYERELYVCFEDSTPQNIQDIAFKVSLGAS